MIATLIVSLLAFVVTSEPHSNSKRTFLSKIDNSKWTSFEPQLRGWSDTNEKIEKIFTRGDDSSKHNSFSFPPLLFLIFSGPLPNSPSPLNLQSVSIKGPWFQGWLIRCVDPQEKRSIILIVGSFSSKRMHTFDQHYVFCGAQLSGKSIQRESFPSPEVVAIKGMHSTIMTTEDFPDCLNISWTANGLGNFQCSDKATVADFNFGDGFSVKMRATNRIPWSRKHPESAGPEGWLAHTNLLPCHYYVYSAGSSCDYSVEYPVANSFPRLAKGCGFAHIEGNSGTFFPEGWVWAQAISADNKASLSFVAGKFVIGAISPINFVLYLRLSDRVVIFRSTDLDRFHYDLDGISGTVNVSATSTFKNNGRIELRMRAEGPLHSTAFGDPIFIPTALGFSNSPGCRETYTATAVATIWEYDHETRRDFVKETVEFPMTALEFGGSFQGLRLKK